MKLAPALTTIATLVAIAALAWLTTAFGVRVAFACAVLLGLPVLWLNEHHRSGRE